MDEDDDDVDEDEDDEDVEKDDVSSTVDGGVREDEVDAKDAAGRAAARTNGSWSRGRLGGRKGSGTGGSSCA